MGFNEYMTALYRHKISMWECSPPDQAALYEARQYLRYIDDLSDEGYTYLESALESEFHGMSRLRGFVAANGAEPFGLPPRIGRAGFGGEPAELSAYLKRVTEQARSFPPKQTPFIDEMLAYSRWLKGADSGAAFVFLLRDTLVPYLDFAGDRRFSGRAFAYPIGRKFFRLAAGCGDFDDRARGVIYEAIEAGASDFSEFWSYCRPRLRALLESAPDVRAELCGLLSGIGAPRVVAVESGVHGTIPLLLMAADERVEMRMYTAAPFLWAQLGGFCFTRAYENALRFETVECQESLFELCGYSGGRFLVQDTISSAVKEAALGEISYVLSKTNAAGE